MVQILTLQLGGITASDYMAWCIDPEPRALGLGLRSVSLEADPLGDSITATLDWECAAPAPRRAAAAAGLPVTDAVCAVRAGGRAQADERLSGAVHAGGYGERLSGHL